MIRVRQIQVEIDKNNLNNIKEKTAKKLNIDANDIEEFKIHKESLDARDKPRVVYVYEVDVKVKNEHLILKKNKSNNILETPNENYVFNVTGTTKLKNRPIIIGSGPAGLFCAYMLAKNGYNPLVIERGEKVEDRIETVEKFFLDSKLNVNSNVQFGEGGAGTFSDGKLTTGTKDPFYRGKEILDIFVKAGAKEEIKYKNKPHIGTDILREVVKNMRNEIINMHAEFRYNSCLTNINIKNDKIVSIEINNEEIIECEALVLAIGHSARDTFELLYDKNIFMTPKPFAVGVRIEHPQEMIDMNQYGQKNDSLEKASYKLTYKSSNGRGVYSFCMCPGGFVVNASSEENRLAVNGMSNNDRASGVANSAIIVTISPNDYGFSPLDGINFQRELEEKAFLTGNGNIPVQLFKDYKNNKITEKFLEITPAFKGNYTFSNINEIFPEYINESLKEAIDYFGKKIKGFDNDSAILAAVESRTSSPVKIERNENGECNIKGIYPCGEGAGYAGGITSAAMDGIKIAENIAAYYINKYE